MSAENVAIVRALYEAFGKGDIPGVLGKFDQKIEWREAENFIYADRNPYIGPNAILEGVFLRFVSEWTDFTVSPDSIIDAGEQVVTLGTYSGTHKKTGKSCAPRWFTSGTCRTAKPCVFSSTPIRSSLQMR